MARHRFLSEYAAVRAAEGRGSEDSAYYRALPYKDLTSRNSGQWRIRSRSFDYLVAGLLPRRSCDVLDLGAGNCWMSYRLGQMHHRSVAVDIYSDSRDGLGCRRHYPMPIDAVEADFDHLPFPAGSFDLVIYNASIHYSPDYVQTLSEARRCLRPDGKILIVDSPLYSARVHGEMMRRERREQFQRQFGFASDALASIEFFDFDMLDELAAKLSIEWQIHRPWYGFAWALRPWKARVLRRRPPSKFWILVGTPR